MILLASARSQKCCSAIASVRFLVSSMPRTLESLTALALIVGRFFVRTQKAKAGEARRHGLMFVLRSLFTSFVTPCMAVARAGGLLSAAAQALTRSAETLTVLFLTYVLNRYNGSRFLSLRKIN